MRTFLGNLFRRLLVQAMAPPLKRQLSRFEAAACDPQKVQEQLLREILAYQADTQFGRDHRFSGIRTVTDFRRHLPVAGYEYFEPYLARVRRGELRALLADRRVHMFALTSGTTAARKYIPVTDRYLTDYRRGWNLWGLRSYKDHPPIRIRPILQVAGDPDEFRTEAGIPCGAVTGLTAAMQKRVIRWLYSVPACVAHVKDAAAKYYTILRLSLPRKVSLLIAANPSTLVNLARAGDHEKERLLRDLCDGTLSAHLDLPREVRAALAPQIRRRHRERVRELEEVVRRTGTLYPRDYWPAEALLGTWTGGSMGAYLRHFPRYFGDMAVRDVGLIASEGRMTIPMTDGTPDGVLDLISHYFEFIPEEEGDCPKPTVLAAHELEEGRKYFILLTTKFGLYRYHIQDVVRVTGFLERTPVLEFLSKGAHFANITGEKLSEYHVTRAMEAVLRELDLTLSAYTLAPCWDDELPFYSLFVESGDLRDLEQGRRLVELLDRRLAEGNAEYAGKRGSLRLGPVRLARLPVGAWRQWQRQRLARSGGSPEQFKHPCLAADLEFCKSLPVLAEDKEDRKPLRATT